MAHPVGCTMTGKNKVPGQCDAKACNYPFCESPDPDRERVNQEMRQEMHLQLLGLAEPR